MISPVIKNRWNSARGLKGEIQNIKVPQIFLFQYFKFSILCLTAGLAVKAYKQRTGASAFQTRLASSVSYSWMDQTKGKA